MPSVGTVGSVGAGGTSGCSTGGVVVAGGSLFAGGVSEAGGVLGVVESAGWLLDGVPFAGLPVLSTRVAVAGSVSGPIE